MRETIDNGGDNVILLLLSILVHMCSFDLSSGIKASIIDEIRQCPQILPPFSILKNLSGLA